ncbi:MAG TPA: Fur family transcriptional regulator [Steroidobacteraceae bacterium]|jgi:Fur family zinc uptake transcriptional regulator|nr:Fur family transcriptional regulator [Steroidobacteraceae bacterium]
MIQQTPRSVSRHDSAKAAGALAAAASLCRERGAQFTEVRRGLLEALLHAAQPLGAYELLSRLETALGRKIAPPTVYRSLDFLMGQGLVSRIESMNAFVPCAHPEHPHVCVFFVCEHCGNSLEVENHALERLIARDASALDFEINRRVVELQGTCAQCRSAA